jgi:hypothetical protein
MAVEYVTTSLGSGEDGEKRREAWLKAAKKSNMKLTPYIRYAVDKLSGYESKKDK